MDGQQRIENTTDEGGDVYEVLCTGVVEGSRQILDSLGIRINLNEIPEVAEYYAEWWRWRWLEWLPGWMFRGARQRLDDLWVRAQQAVMSSVIGTGIADLEKNG